MPARAPLLIAACFFAAAASGTPHSKEAERLYARAVANADKGDYWQALRDAETVLRADPGWTAAQRLRRTAGYEAHYHEGLRLMDTSDWKNAADQFENARTYANTPALAAKLRLARSYQRQEVAAQEMAEHARAAAESARSDYLASVTRALEAGDWKLVEERIRQVPVVPEPATPTVHDDLLASFRLYAAGHSGEARAAARLFDARHNDPAARSFLLFLNSRTRHEKLAAGLGLMGGLYAVALLLSLYAGLRHEVQGGMA